ncbi:MAG: peptidoglycan-associated lipoprotein Pal, partial [candidate division Zixibacteria bacterium]|nr:peptidoglycan-associated lipoprotein Pal [candidate division Zixibacteria bacterium]
LDPKVETPPEAPAPPPPQAPQPPPPPPPPATIEESQFVTVYFDFDKFNLHSEAKAALDANYNLLMEFPSAIAKIEGHCDERGTVEYNLSLGEKRAKAAKDYLVGLGIAPARLSFISYGKERPANPGSNEAAWDKNRRCEFRVVSQ